MFHTPSLGEDEYDFLLEKNSSLIPTEVLSSQGLTLPVTNCSEIEFYQSGNKSPLILYQSQVKHYQSNTVNLQLGGGSLGYSQCNQIQNFHQQQQQLQSEKYLNNNQQQPNIHQQLTKQFCKPQNHLSYLMTTQRDSILDSLESIAPKFPPQDVDIPDISTTNGLSMPLMSSVLDSGFHGHQVSLSGSPRLHPSFPDLTFSSTTMVQSSTTRISPSSSIVNMSPPLESSEDSDDSVPLAQLVKRQADDLPPVKASSKTAAAKKPRIPKKKKKKDPNEPQKPVSAYALFFRDTQAAIKGQNPNATFGEVSKIVASMWEGLDPEHKNMYKKKTEVAKKEYLKQLAAYRASLVSQTAMEESPSPTRNSPTTASPQPLLSYMNHLSPQHMGSPLHTQSPQHIPNRHYESSPPHLIAQHMTSPQHVSSPQYMVSPQHIYSNVQSPPQYNNGPSPPQYNNGPSPPQYNNGPSPPHCSNGPSPLQYNSGPSPPQYNNGPSPPQYNNGWPISQYSMGRGYNQHMNVLDNGGLHMNSHTLAPTGVNAGNVYQAGMCVRTGCHNRAIDNIGWDNEYCSNECVVSHCRDVFAAWVANRQVPVSSYIVK